MGPDEANNPWLHAGEEIGFREVQRRKPWWVWSICLAVAAVAWYFFVEQIIFGRPVGSKPGPDWIVWVIVALAGIGLPVFIYSWHLVTEVTPSSLRIKCVPLGKRTIALESIEHCEARSYRPILEYGGWGIRWTPWAGTAWNIFGHHGVQLRLTNGQRLLIGSQQPDDLAAAIEQATGGLSSASNA